MRELTMDETVQVGGGSASTFNALVTAFKIGYSAGAALYESMSTEEQNAVGGTIDAALHNLGISEASDVPR